MGTPLEHGGYVHFLLRINWSHVLTAMLGMSLEGGWPKILGLRILQHLTCGGFFEWTEQEHLRDLSMGFLRWRPLELEIKLLHELIRTKNTDIKTAASLSTNQLIACSGYLFWGSLPTESAGERATPPPSRSSRFCLSVNVDVLAEKLGSGGRWGGGMGKVMVSGTFQSLEDFLDFVGEKNPRRVNWFVWVLDIIIYIFLFRSSVIT